MRQDPARARCPKCAEEPVAAKTPTVDPHDRPSNTKARVIKILIRSIGRWRPTAENSTTR